MKKLILAFLLHAGPLLAQQGTTADLIGTVTSGGQQIPGVTVTLTSNALQIPRRTTTGGNGGYRFTFLPPGDYVAHFELQGFRGVERPIRVALAETMRGDVELALSDVRAEVVVESTEPHAGATIANNLSSADLARLPGGRDVRAVALLSPSVNVLGNNNALVISAAPSWDSLFLVDGVVANAYLSGQPHNIVLEDAIQEVSVLTGAIPAEYGRFTGGVVSALTKSGGNAFSGSLRDTLTNPKWTARTPWPVPHSGINTNNHALETTLGGLLVRNRLWFFLAGRHAETTSQRFTTLTNVAYPTTGLDERWEGKLTDQISAQHAAVVSYAKSSLSETNVTNFRSGPAVEIPALIPDRLQLTRFLAATYNGVLSTNTSAEVHGSKKGYALRGNGGQSIDPIAGTIIVLRQGGVLNAPFGCGICGDDRRESNSGSAKASHYANTRSGNHTLTAGAELFRERRTNAGTRSASDFNIQTGSAVVIGANAYPVITPTSTAIVWTPHFPGDRGSNLNTNSGFVEDRWQISTRLTLNAGLRYDRNDATDAAGRRISDDAAWSPRLALTWDLRNDGRQQFFASYNRYSAQVLEGGGNPQQVGVFNQYGWTYAGPSINDGGVLVPAPQALAQLFGWFDSVGGTQNRQYLQFITLPDTSNVFHGSLKSPSVDERSVGYAFQFRDGSVRADYIRRDWHNFYAFRVDQTTGQEIGPLGAPLDIGWVVNDNSGTVRAYRAVQLQSSWRYKPLTLGAGYTWSRLWGNDDEEDLAGLGPRNLPLSLYYPEILGYPQRRPIGYLRQDQRHRARIWSAYQAGQFSASVLQWFDSGRPFSAEADIDVKNIVAHPAYVLNQVAAGPYYFSRRGAYRTDDVYSTDIALRYEIPIRAARLFAKVDVLNALNNAAVIAPSAIVIDRFRNGTTSGLVGFNPFTETPVEGVHYRLSPDFGKPNGPQSYQTPRTYQIALGARF